MKNVTYPVMKITILVVLFICGIIQKTSSCDCVMNAAVTYYIDKVDFIFTGKVIELIDSVHTNQYLNSESNKLFFTDKAYKVKVIIIEPLKINAGLPDTLEFTSNYTNCDPIYQLNESYLFFANSINTRKFIMANCKPWGTVAESSDKIISLRKYFKK